MNKHYSPGVFLVKCASLPLAQSIRIKARMTYFFAKSSFDSRGTVFTDESPTLAVKFLTRAAFIFDVPSALGEKHFASMFRRLRLQRSKAY